MRRYCDVFNGDADGLCAWLQWRLAQPAQAQIFTGVKRDIGLLAQVEAQPGDQVSVFDISLDKNRVALLNLLQHGVEVFYVDHHFAGEIPQHPGLTSIIDTQPNICSALLVNQQLQNRYAAWAVVGAFGDNLHDSAYQLARQLALDNEQLAALKQLGICLNYNSYGESLADLFYPPQQLALCLINYQTPFAFLSEQAELVGCLQEGYQQDMTLAMALQPVESSAHLAVFMLPDAAWARRVTGVWSNQLANEYPDRAHAVLSPNAQEGFQVSVRAPLSRKSGADELCRQFVTGGGRQAAAGINCLPKTDYPRFVQAFTRQYSLIQ